MTLLTPRRFLIRVGLFALFTAVAFALSPFFGSEKLDVWGAVAAWWNAKTAEARPPEVDIMIYLRLPRVVMALLAGAGLAVAGTVFQALLRNPLATPYTLGIASGGSFGAVMAMYMPSIFPAFVFQWGPFNHTQCLAFGGAAFAVILIYLLARTGGRISTMELLLAGVTLGMIFSALILSVQNFAEPGILKAMDRWLMGSVQVTGWHEVVSVLPLLIPGLLVLLGLANGLNQISFGEDLATGRGVNVGRLQKVAFFGGSLVTGSVVAVVGPIGFVGLIVPHIVRRLVGPDHRLLLPCSMLAGGAFLIICDAFARTLIAPVELPVGVITSLLGGPFFIYLLIRGRRNRRLWGDEA